MKTVYDLIKELEKYPKDTQVLVSVYDEGESYAYPIEFEYQNYFNRLFIHPNVNESEDL